MLSSYFLHIETCPYLERREVHLTQVNETRFRKLLKVTKFKAPPPSPSYGGSNRGHSPGNAEGWAKLHEEGFEFVTSAVWAF